MATRNPRGLFGCPEEIKGTDRRQWSTASLLLCLQKNYGATVGNTFQISLMAS